MVEVEAQALAGVLVEVILLATADDARVDELERVKWNEAVVLLDHARDVRALEHHADNDAAIRGEDEVMHLADLLGISWLIVLLLLLGLLSAHVDA